MDTISSVNEDCLVTSGEDALRSHLVCFAAEKARRTKQVVNIKDFIASIS